MKPPKPKFVEEAPEPMRINKKLAKMRIASRREADKLISAGLVMINGKRADLGSTVMPGDNVQVLERSRHAARRIYFAYNKPIGVVTTNATRGDTDILRATRFPVPVFPIGRLDKDSHGLIIMTNDGRVTGRLLEPEQYHEKEYEVTVNKAITKGFLAALQKGVTLDDNYTTRGTKVKQLGAQRFSIILTEGKNRQIRRMCESEGYVVRDLVRTRVMNIHLARLKHGQFRELRGKELVTFLSSLGLTRE
jgi:23S rRNA pseudouridine2604 synthase